MSRCILLLVIIVTFGNVSLSAELSFLDPVSSLVRLHALERIAVLEGINSMFEIKGMAETTVLENVVAGQSGDKVIVCGHYNVMSTVKEKYYDKAIPFIGGFIPSRAAFINKTYVPLLVPGYGVTPDKVVETCASIGLDISSP